MTSGGDAAGMNPAIKAAVDHARQLGMNPYVVYDGLEGLIDGKIKEATRELTNDMIYRGGTLLRSSRSKRFFDYEFRKQAYEHLKKRNIDKLIIMGGDGSFRALNDFFNDFEVPFAGIPATIDNDIAGTDYCLGVDTAQNVILDCIDSVRDTARSHHRAFVIETMGRDCGYLAMTTALCSAADICIVPEIPYDLESIYKRLQPVINEEGSCIIAVVAEGTRVAQYLTRWLTERAGMDTRLTVLITNCSNNYGPYQFPEKLIPVVILKALGGEPIPVYGKGENVRDWLYVGDHCEALLTVVSCGKPGETYNIGGNNEKTNLELVELLCSHLDELRPRPDGRSYREQISFVQDRPGHDLRYAIDASKIRRELGWTPRQDHSSGFRKTIQWYLDHEEWWRGILSGEYRLERLGTNG